MTQCLYIPKFKLQGIINRGPSSFNVIENAGANFGSALWQRFIEKLVENDLPLEMELFGVSWPADDLTPPQEIYYFCGFASDATNAGFEQLEVDGGNYFVHECKVLADNLDEGFKDAYFRALPESGLRSRDGKHLEIYGEKYDPNSPIAEFKILIPVE